MDGAGSSASASNWGSSSTGVSSGAVSSSGIATLSSDNRARSLAIRIDLGDESIARAVRPDSNDCISRMTGGEVRWDGEWQAGVSKVTPRPNGCRIASADGSYSC